MRVTRKKDGPIVTEPVLLVFEEKLVFEEEHGSRRYHIPDDATLFKASLKVLTERNEEGYWYPEPEGEAPTPPDVKEADIPNLPKSLQDAARKQIRTYLESKRDYDKERVEYDAIQKAIESEDGRAAWDILYDRRDAEYEGVTLEHYDTLDDDDD